MSYQTIQKAHVCLLKVLTWYHGSIREKKEQITFKDKLLEEKNKLLDRLLEEKDQRLKEKDEQIAFLNNLRDQQLSEKDEQIKNLRNQANRYEQEVSDNFTALLERKWGSSLNRKWGEHIFAV